MGGRAWSVPLEGVPVSAQQHAPRCIDCGEEAEYELVSMFGACLVPNAGDPICALCAHGRGLKEYE